MKSLLVLAVSAVVVVVLIAVAGLNVNSDTKVSAKQQVVGARQEPIERRGKELILKIDDTYSISPTARPRGEELLVKIAERAINDGGFTFCRIQHIGERGWVLDEKVIRLPHKVEQPCSEPKIPEDRTWYKPWVNHEEKKASQLCEKQRDDATRAFDNGRSETLRRITEAVRNSQQENSQCTAFDDALASSALTSQPSLTVILSDAVDTCARSIQKLPTPKAGVSIELIMLPSRYDEGRGLSAYKAFQFRKASLQKMAPWLRVEPPTFDTIEAQGIVRSTF
jgi:hypothetical protein